MESFLRIQEQLWEETLLGEDEPVLYCRCSRPLLARMDGRAQRRINRYYQRMEQRFQRWCKLRLYPIADRERREARAVSHPFEPWEVKLSFSHEIKEGRLQVVLTFCRVKNDSSSVTRQCIQHWNLKNGFPIAVGTEPAEEQPRSN